MPSTYTLNLGLEKPAIGEQAGVWGTTANNSYDFLDTGIDGNVTIPLSASAYTLLTNQGAASTGRNKVIVFTGALSNDGSITIAPNNAQKLYFVTNYTTGGFALNFSQGTGGSFSLANGYSAVIYADGQGGAASVSGALSDLQTNSLLVQTNLIIKGQITGVATFAGMVTCSAGITINVGSDAAYDTYYRSPAGPVARLGNGAAGQVLQATATGPAWTTVPPPALGTVISGAAPNLVFFAGPSSQLAQDTGFYWKPTVGLGIGAGVPARALTIGPSVPAVVQLEATADGVHAPAQRALLYSSNGVPRWSMDVSNELEAATGASVAGANWFLTSFNNNFSVSKNAFSCYRTGRMTVGVYADSWDSQFTVMNSIGAGNIQMWANGAGAAVAWVDAAGGGHFSNVLGGVNIQINGGAPFTGPFTYLNFVAQAGMIINSGGIGGPGGNTFTINFASTTSDIQLKRNVQPLAGGLALINRLRPVSAEWNGFAGTPEGRHLVSVIAQDLQAVIPEAVSPYRARLRPGDEKDVELLGLEPMAITSHLILAVQQLEARLKALEP